MAVSIIKKGKVKHSVYKAECDICGCVFEFEKQDAEVRNSHDLENSYLKIDCPCCGWPIHHYDW